MSFQRDLNSIISSTKFDIPDIYLETNIGFLVAILIFSLVDSKIIMYLMVELLYIFKFSMFPPITENAKEQITTTNPYSNPYLMSGSSLFLFAVFYRTSDGSLKRKSNSFFIVFFTFCVTIYLCLLTATLLPFTFILSSLLHSSPFVLSKILVRFLFVLQTDVWFPPAVGECAVPCVHFSRTKMRSVCLFNFVRLHPSTYTFLFFVLFFC